MKKRLAILYAESEFTPWKENIDAYTVNVIRDILLDEFKVDIWHMEHPTDYLGKILRQYDGVINLCYGFMEHTQADIATWLDHQQVNHYSTPGFIQRQVQDKLYVEKKSLQFGIEVPLSIHPQTPLNKENTYILKPRFGSCHRGIHILNGESMCNLLMAGNFKHHILQEYIAGREFSVAVIPSNDGLTYQSLPPVEIKPTTDREIFVAGNSFGATLRTFTYDLDLQILERMMSVAISFHVSMGLRYISRMDFRLRGEEIYLLDVNSMPNLHPQKSLLPALLEHHQIPFSTFFQNCIKINESYKLSMEPALVGE